MGATKSSIRNRSLRFAAIGALLLAGVLVTSGPVGATDSKVADVAVHDATSITFAPGLQGSPPSSRSQMVSCPADGECVVVGSVSTADTPSEYRTFVAVQHAGVWGQAQIVSFDLAPDYTYNWAEITGIECFAPGECDVIGWLDDGAAFSAGFHFRVTGGVVQPAQWLPISGPGLHSSFAYSLACTSPGECIVLGWATPLNGGVVAVDWVVTGGVAAMGTSIILPPTLSDPSNPGSQGMDVECTAVGECIEFGWAAIVGPTAGQLWVRVQTGGAWGTAQTVAFDPSAVYQLGSSVSGILECWAVGECTVIGSVPLVANTGGPQLFSAQVSGGVLGAPTMIPAVAGVPVSANWFVRSAMCPGVSSCVAVASAWDPVSSTALGSWRLSMVGGVWSTPVELVSPIADLRSGVESVDCVRVGSCVAVGYVLEGSGASEVAHGVVYVERDGVWHDAVVTEATPVIPGSSLSLFSISCVNGGVGCVSVGGSGDVLLGIGEVSAAPSSTSTAQRSNPTALGQPMVAVPNGAFAVTQLTEFLTPPVTPVFTG